MLTRTRNLFALAILFSAVAGCATFGGNAASEQLTASQLRSQELFAENEQLLLANGEQQQMIGSLEQDRQLLSGKLARTESQLSTSNVRIDNLLAERGELKGRYAQVLKDTTSDSFITGLPTAEIPGFDMDPLTGLNKFPEDVLFDLGSAELRPETAPILREFANQVNSYSAQGLRILVVGHTDDQRIARAATAAKHPTNWHLSTDRSDQVIVALEQLGISPERMAAMGYSRFQPLETTTDEPSRQRNRRVELYIVPESTNVAAWDPIRSLN